MAKFCISCGKEMEDNQQFCPSCGSAQNAGAPAAAKEGKSKMAAGLLGLFLGAWGIHNFYLGNTGRGIAQIIVTSDETDALPFLIIFLNPSLIK